MDWALVVHLGFIIVLNGIIILAGCEPTDF